METYLETLASSDPTPGGGSGATIVIALGAALVSMVARITFNNAMHGERHPLASDLVARADDVRMRALIAREADEAAYGRVIGALALPKRTPAEKDARTGSLQTALRDAALAPLETARLAATLAALAESGLALENRPLASDLGCAAEFAAAGLAAAALNVRVNHAFMRDGPAVAEQRARLSEYECAAASPVERVRREVARAVGE